jgi:hypothetical protein
MLTSIGKWHANRNRWKYAKKIGYLISGALSPRQRVLPN